MTEHRPDVPRRAIHFGLVLGMACTLRYNLLMNQVTRILESLEGGGGKGAEELLPAVYGELRKLARARLADERNEQTLQPTALVHEAWMKLSPPGRPGQRWNSRAHFFGAAAVAMRRILIDRARRRRRERHGAGLLRVDLNTVDVATSADDETLLRVNEALERFAGEHPAKAELVVLRFFGGMTIGEACEVLGISPATAKRHWTYSRAWLLRELQGAEAPPPSPA
jgi:RNA polymerase sigma factor (TIGR02999 family)